MSSIVKNQINKKEEFTITETDFLLKLMMNSKFDGVDIEVAYSVLTKMSKMHKAKLES